ncbi:hypothetical protein RHMOL_Rhmol04G0258300 [Rhododendron molle]|uniref:Uncharacterized protein n=1 Tax=Rhododendron molle TaxID=49168 RepID=A0ACC0P4N9_RHOML|nr:hypothetical protein RHMOL_Rhmol04G0258300 [Rhododendron molle]
MLLYDALSPLSSSTASTTAAAPATASPSGKLPPLPVYSEPYAVFPNKISLSVVQPHSATAVAPENFSFDLGKDETTVEYFSLEYLVLLLSVRQFSPC